MFAASKEFSSSQSMLAPVKNLTVEVDLVRSYLRDIGRVPLLSHEQEITLGRQVQELMRLDLLESEFLANTGEQPSLETLADLAGLTVPQLKQKRRSAIVQDC